MDTSSIAEVLAASAAVGGVIFAAGQFTESIKANTKVTEKLSSLIDNHLTWSAEIVREHDERFHDLDKRVSALE